MNWLEKKRYTRTLLGDNIDPAKAAYSETVVSAFLNEAIVTVAGKLGCTRSFFDGKTVAYDNPGLSAIDSKRQGRYPLPYPCLSIKGITLTYSGIDTQLERLSFDEFEERYSQENRANKPEAFRVEFGSPKPEYYVPGDIWFGPLPNGVYDFRVFVYKYPTTIGELDDTFITELPTIAHKPVCLLAALELSMRHDDTSRMNKLAPMYTAALEEAERAVARFDRIGPFEVKSVYGPSKHWFRRKR